MATTTPPTANPDTALVKLDAARAALAECKTVMEVKGIADMAEAARVYLERTNASVETVNHATEIRLLAERQMGEFLKAMPKNPGGYAPSVNAGGGGTKLAEHGVSYRQSSNAQKLAAIPAQEFQERIAVAKIDGKLSTASVLNPAPSRRPQGPFNAVLWRRQAQSIMASWLRAVPPTQLDDACDYLSKLPAKIIEQNK